MGTNQQVGEVAANPEFWRDRWRTRRTGWDQGGPHPELMRLVEMAEQRGLLVKGARILEPGCGRAHGGAALAMAGYRVTAFDVAPEAVDEARALYGNVPGLELAVQDALTPVAAWRQSFAAVYDRAVLCALPRDLRPAYVHAIREHLEPGGILLSVPFIEVRLRPEDGPPFAIGKDELHALLSPDFELVLAHEVELGPEDRIAREMPCIYRRRQAE